MRSNLGPIWRKRNLADDIIYAKASEENKLGFSLELQMDWLDHIERGTNDWRGSRVRSQGPWVHFDFMWKSYQEFELVI